MQPQQPNPTTSSLKEEDFLLSDLSKLQNKRQQEPSQHHVQQEEEQTQLQNSQQPEEYQPLEGYIISKTLGKGNFGKVKLAIHKLTQQYVAVKILQKDLIFQNTDIVRISRQLKIMKKLRHPFVVQLYEIIETPKELYLIMEYAEGGDLFDKIVYEEKIKEKEAAAIFTQIALGMEYFHSKGVTHRDLKPENILLSKDGTIKIADFGLGNMFKPDEKLKTACGSPCYASPQMLNREAYDPQKIDIWSAGIILYALVCGYLPFEDQVTSKLYEKIKTTNTKIPSWVSGPCRNLIRGLLTKDPKLRFDIESILSHEMIAPHTEKYREMVKQRELTENKIEQICEKYDIEEREKLISDLNKNRHNYLTTLYYLAVKRIQRMEGDQDEDEDEFLKGQNEKVKGKKSHSQSQKMEDERKANQRAQEDDKNLTNIESEGNKDLYFEKQAESNKMEEQAQEIQETKQQMQGEQQFDEESPHDETSLKVTESILNSAQKSLNSGKELSDGELEIHNLHHEMEFEGTEVPVFEQKKQTQDKKDRKQYEGQDTVGEFVIKQGNIGEEKIDEKVEKSKQKENWLLQSFEGVREQIDEQKVDEGKIIEESYQLSMQIQKSLAQLNQLTQFQQEGLQKEDQYKEEQEESNQLTTHDKIQLFQNSNIHNQPASLIHFSHHQIKVIESRIVEETKSNQDKQYYQIQTDNQITYQQSTEFKHQGQQLIIAENEQEQQTHNPPESHAEQPEYSQPLKPKKTQILPDNSLIVTTQQNTNQQNQFKQNEYLNPSDHVQEPKQNSLPEISLTLPQIQQSDKSSKKQEEESLPTVQPQFNSQKFPSQLFKHPSNPSLFPLQTVLPIQQKQLQQQSSRFQQVETPKTPPKPISPTKNPKNIQKPKPQKQPLPQKKVKQISQLPKTKELESKPQIKPLIKPKLSRQQPNRHLLFSKDKTLSKPSKQDESSKDIESQTTFKEQSKTTQNGLIKPINRNIRFNQRSQSRDSPIVFKSNKNPNKLSEILKKNIPNKSSSKQKLQQQSPRHKQLKQKIPSKDGKLASSLEKDKIFNPGKQKIMIAKQKTTGTREKFQIAKKVETKLQNNPKVQTNKSIEKPQKAQKILTLFKQVAESIYQEADKSVQKNSQKVKPKINYLLNNNSNKKTQHNFSDRFRKNGDEKKSELAATSNEYEQVSISPVSGYYLREEGDRDMSTNIRESMDSSYGINHTYSSKQKQKLDKNKYNQGKVRTKVTISQYSSTTTNPKFSSSYQKTPKSSTSITISSSKFYQPQSKYSNIYQQKNSGKNDSTNLNNTISSFGFYGNRTKSNRLNTVSYVQQFEDLRDGDSKKSESNTEKFQRIQIEEFSNNSTLNIQFVYSEPELINFQLILFVSVKELYQIVQGLSKCSQNSLNIEGILTVFEYPTKDYLYIIKSDLLKSSSQMSTSSKVSSSNYSKMLSMSQYSPGRLRQKSQSINKTTIQTFEFVELINSIVLEENQSRK